MNYRKLQRFRLRILSCKNYTPKLDVPKLDDLIVSVLEFNLIKSY